MKTTRREAVNFRLPTDVLAAIRKRATQDRVPRTSVVEAALRAFLGTPTYVDLLRAEIERRDLAVPSVTTAKGQKGVAR